MKLVAGALLVALVAVTPGYAAEDRAVPKDKGKTEKPKDPPKDNSKGDSKGDSKEKPPALPPSAIPGANNNRGGTADSGGGNSGNDHCKGSPDCSKGFDGGK